MIYAIVDNPKGCWKPEGEKPASCKTCYYSQVKNAQWTGSDRCWNAQCLAAEPVPKK